MATNVTVNAGQGSTQVTVITGEGSTSYKVEAGSRGPAGTNGTNGTNGAAGPNSVTTSTSSNLTGFIVANGTNVSGATAGATAATANTLALRDATGGSNFAAVGASSVTSSGAITTTAPYAEIYTDANYSSISTRGLGAPIYTSQPDSRIETRATFDLFNGDYRTTLSHSPTANHAIAFPDKDGTVAMTSDITGTNSGTNTGDQTSIVGITGTLAQFNTAVTDADFASLAGTETLTNKRITPRITSITSSATPTINTDTCDAVTITALAEAITSMTTNLTGTPANFDMLLFRIKDNGTDRAIAWGASFEAKGAALPTTTVLSKILHALFIWDSVAAKWGCLSTSQEA